MSLEHSRVWTGSSGDPQDEQFGDVVERAPLEAAGNYEAVLIGQPYDGAVIGRAGAREGPAAIREALATTKTHHFDAGPVESVADLGDVVIPGGESVSDVQDAVRRVTGSVHDAATIPIFLGGDGSLTHANVAPLLGSGRPDGGYVTDGGFGEDDDTVGDVEHFDPTGGSSEGEESESATDDSKDDSDDSTIDDDSEAGDDTADTDPDEADTTEDGTDGDEKADEAVETDATEATARSEAAGEETPSVGVVSLDAHLDYREIDGQPTSGTAYRQLLDAGLNALAVLGARHFETTTAYATELRASGAGIVTAEEIAEDTVDAAERALDAVADVDSVYVSIDMDVLDTTAAPGVSAPTPGGITTRELFRIVRLLASEDRLAGIEIVETAPPLCPDGRTARGAARTVAHAVAVA